MDIELITIGALILGVLIGRVISPRASSPSILIESKVNAIIEHLGVDFKPYKNIPKEIVLALENKERIKAIKLYRQFSGVGLKEASEVISYIENNPSTVA